MARHDIGLAFIDELSSGVRQAADRRGIVRASQHGVDVTYLREMAERSAIGSIARAPGHATRPRRRPRLRPRARRTRLLNNCRLTTFERRAITGSRPIRARDARQRLRVADDRGAINARDHGVTPEYVRELGEAGHRKLPLQQVIRVRDHGVGGEYARDMRRSVSRCQSTSWFVRGSRRDRGVRARDGSARLHEPDARQPDSHSRPRRDAGLRESAEGARLRPHGSRGPGDAAGSRADCGADPGRERTRRHPAADRSAQSLAR